MRDHFCRKIISLLLILLFLLPVPSAAAARPEDEPLKGNIPASSPVLEQDSLPDGSDYEPVPVHADTLLIGLSYDQSAVKEAVFKNTEDLGFRFGFLDEDRVFHPSFETASSEMSVRIEQKWYMLLDEVFASEEDAERIAARHYGKVVNFNGERRIQIG